MKTVNIYGEAVEGEEIEYKGEPPKNVIIVKDSNGSKHVVHKETIDPKFRRVSSGQNNSFNLYDCQTNGRPKTSGIWRRRRGI